MVAIKPLIWQNEPGRDADFPGWIAQTHFGKEYRVFKAWWGAQKKWGFVGAGGFFHTENEAKAADQADYEQRILAALEPLSQAEGQEPVADIFESLRSANVSRQAAWCPEQVPDLSFRGNELAGETGEVCNVIKKLERERLGWRGSRDTIEHLAEELADVVICADLVAISSGIDLNAAVVAKFNATSEKVGLPHRLTHPAETRSGQSIAAPSRAEVEK